MTFLHKQICVHVCLGEKLAAAKTLLEQQGFTQASQLDVQRIIPVHYPADNRVVTMAELTRWLGRAGTN